MPKAIGAIAITALPRAQKFQPQMQRQRHETL
jgi:hypothetical protein